MTTIVNHRNDSGVSVTTDTEGEAFLRNGWSKVTRLSIWDSCDNNDNKVYIEVINSRGNLTNGMIIVKQADLLEAAARYILAKTNMEANLARLNELAKIVVSPVTMFSLADLDEERVDIWEEIATALISLAGNTEDI